MSYYMSKHEPMSGIDLLNYFPNRKPNLIMYSDLRKYKGYMDLLGKSGRCIILYRTSKNIGHWCCIWKNSKGLNFFDSYGLVPDDQLGFAPNHLRADLDQDFKYLTKLLLESGLEVYYNEYQLQDFDDTSISTCGRWCIVRLQYPNIGVEAFKNIFKNKSLSPDDIVYELTK